MSNIKFGWAEVDITPERKVALSGQFAERISEYVEKPITATAMAVSSDDDQMILVSCDLVGTPCNLIDAVRQLLKDNEVGIDPIKIVLNAIHTHTGPEFPREQRTKLPFLSSTPKRIIKSLLPPGKNYVEKDNVSDNHEICSPEDTFEFLVNKIEEVILKAWANREEGMFANAFGRAAVGMCRRAVYSDGTAQMWGDTDKAVFVELEGGSDTGIELMYVFDKDKNLTGIVANIACPAQCVQHRMFVSPDFWGEVKLLLRKHFGEDLFLLPQCSAAGDQCPVDLIRWVEPESSVNDPNIERKNPLKRKADPSMFDLSGMRKVGRRIANEIIEVYNDGLNEYQYEPEFKHNVRILQLPIRRATLTEAENAQRKISEYLRDKEGDVNYIDAAKLQVYLGILKRMEIQDLQDVLDTEVHVIRLGTIAIATNPFELFLDYGNQIKARSHAEQTFIIQLANGSEGYLPTEKAERGGHYSAFISGGQVGHVGGDQLVRETLNEINVKLFD